MEGSGPARGRATVPGHGPGDPAPRSRAVDFMNINTEDYSERGAGGLNLNVKSNNYQELVFAVDHKINQQLSDGINLNANLGLGYDALSGKSSVTTNYVGGGGAFVTKGIDPSPFIFMGGVSTAVEDFHGADLSLNYDVEARTSDYTNQTASVKVTMPF